MAQRLGFLFLLLGAAPACAQPVPAPLPPPVTAPQDRHFPGEIALSVDATDVDRHIFRMHETIPVPAHENLTLVLSKWLPGNHAPTGPIPLLAGLVITAGGQELNWQRDPVNMYAFHVDVPAGTPAIKVAFEYLSPLDSKQGRITITQDMLDVSWRPETLFPAGYYQRDISVRASVTLPAAWQYATALTTLVSANGRVDFAPVPLDVLLDSPAFCRPLCQPHRSRSEWRGAGAFEYLCRQATGFAGISGGLAGAPQPCAAGVPEFRQPSLRPL